MRDPKILLLNLPSPSDQRLWRDDAGGFGAAIHVPKKFKNGHEITLHPFFPYASALLLKAGYEFKVYDCQRLRTRSINEVLALVRKENPDIIFSIISLPSIWNDLSVLTEIKKVFQNVWTIGVGTVCRVIQGEVLYKGGVDAVLRNEFPYVSGIIDLIRALQRRQDLKNIKGISYIKNGQIIDNPSLEELDINDLPEACYDFTPLDGYETFTDKYGERFAYVSILDSKGCPYKCFYCPYPLGYGERWSFRSPKSIVDEMEKLYNDYNIRGFAFRGQSFAYNKEQAIKICDEIIKRKLDVAWICESRVNEVSREVLLKMKKAGCRRIHYGVETGDPEILKIAKVGVKQETIERAFKLSKKMDILTQAHIILGWPNETIGTIENTRKLILKLDPDILNINFLTPYPGTKLYEVACQNSLLITTDWSKFTSHDIVIKTKYLSTTKLFELKNKIVRYFLKQRLKKLLLDINAYKRPYYLLNSAKKLMEGIVFP
ncbi:MAG: B12-binding domain-containing radical SAM protein [Candidatus Aenigmatarchaeota archaeon]